MPGRDERYLLTISLTTGDAEGEFVTERAYCSSLAGVFAEFSEPGYTSKRFLDTIEALFERGATAPRIVVEK